MLTANGIWEEFDKGMKELNEGFAFDFESEDDYAADLTNDNSEESMNDDEDPIEQEIRDLREKQREDSS